MAWQTKMGMNVLHCMYKCILYNLCMCMCRNVNVDNEMAETVFDGR